MNPVDTILPMRTGYVCSFALHACVLAVAVYGLPLYSREYMVQSAVPVDLVMFDDVKEADLASLPEISDLTPQDRLVQADEIAPQVVRPNDLAEEVEDQAATELDSVEQAEPPDSPPPDSAVAPDISTLPALDDLAAAETPLTQEAQEAEAAPLKAADDPAPPPLPVSRPEALQLAELVEPEPEPEPESATPAVTELTEAVAEEPETETTQQLAALAPPMPQRRPELPQRAERKEPESQNSNRLASILRNVQKNLQQPQAQAATSAAQPAAVRQGDEASSSRLAGQVRRQVQPCWSFDAGARDPASLIVEMRVFLNPDGSLSGQPEVLDRQRYLSDPFFRSAAERAQRAVLDCQPFNLPRESHSLWSSLLIRFNPAEAF